MTGFLDAKHNGKEKVMRSKSLLAVVAIVGLGLSGCFRGAVPGAEVTPLGTVVFNAEASSVVARQDDPLALLEAKTAAETMAQAELLKKIKGAFVSGEATVGDLMFASQEASTRVEGYLSRVEVTFSESPAEEGMVTAKATLEIPRAKESLADYVD